jgi:hypothetical protein
MPPVNNGTRLNDKDRQRLSTFLRLLDSGQGGEITTAVSNIKRILNDYKLSFSDLAENPDNLLEPVNQNEMDELKRKYDECIDANIGFVQQNEALRKENQRLRQRVSLIEAFKVRVHVPLRVARFPLYALTGPVGLFAMERLGVARRPAYESPVPYYLGATALCAAFWVGSMVGDNMLYDSKLQTAFQSAACQAQTNDKAACEQAIESVRSPIFHRGMADITIETGRSRDYTSAYTTKEGRIAATTCHQDQITIYDAKDNTILQRQSYESCTPK